MDHPVAEPQTSSPPRNPLLPKVIILVVAFIALVIFIAILGDVRRVRNAARQAETHAALYRERAADIGTIPLNLEPNIPPALMRRHIKMHWLSRDQVHLLRRTEGPTIVAWTAPVFRLFGHDGRAVIFFRDGKFAVEWRTLTEFDEALASQDKLIQQLKQDEATGQT